MIRERPGFNHKRLRVMGILILLSGVLSVILGGVLMGVAQSWGIRGYAIWCGLIFIVTGILGITSCRYKNNCNIISLMVMCIISSMFALAMLVHACASIGNDARQGGPYIYFGNHGYCKSCAWVISFQASLILLSILVFVTSIVCSSFCCKALSCCWNGPKPGALIGYHQCPTQMDVAAPGFYPSQTGQGVFVPNQGHHRPVQMMMAPPAYTVAPPTGTVDLPDGQPVYQPQTEAMVPSEYTTSEQKTKTGTFDYTKLQEDHEPPQ